MTDTTQLVALQALGSTTTRYSYAEVQPTLLERFLNPLYLSEMNLAEGYLESSILITCPEFTSLCPLTGQPDFAKIVIEYTPDQWCVESKSLKLYLGSYRNVGEFHESCVASIANNLITLLNPQSIKVRGEFTPRGGIPFWPEVKFERNH